MSKIECQVGAVGRQVMVAGDKIEGKSSRQRDSFSMSKSKLTVNDPGHYDGCLSLPAANVLLTAAGC